MLETKEIQKKFSSLQDFEKFSLKWTRACAKLNKQSKNAEILPMAERRARSIGVVE